MSPFPPVHVIAVCSRDGVRADFFKRALDSSGFAAFIAPVEPVDLEAFVHAIQPAAMVLDVASVDEAQWEELVKVCGRWPCRDIPVVLTAGDKRELHAQPAATGLTLAPVVEMFTHGHDLRELRAAVRQLVTSGLDARWRRSRTAGRAS